jgi:SAM-dependent methyltransferase
MGRRLRVSCENGGMQASLEGDPGHAQAITAEVTGERVVTPVGGFNLSWQRHVAEYALGADLLGPGRVLDLGCGIGHSYHLLAPRESVGVDIEPAALAGQKRQTVVADMRGLPFGDDEFASVLSVHSLEHVPDPDRVLAEAARVLEPGGQAVFVTPNRLTLGRPDEIIDPYHYVEFDHRELRTICERQFGEVTIRGLFGSPRYMELHNEERARMNRSLALDPLRVRRLLSRRMRQRLYDAALRRDRRRVDSRVAVIAPGDFELRDELLDESLDLFAICTAP